MRNQFLKQAIALIFICGASLSLLGQTIKTTSLNVGQGLSSSTVNSVIQDSYGFLWFAGENGVQRYDGFTFKNFQHDPKDSTSLMNNLCWNISEASDGDIWVGTESGISRYDRASDHFTNYRIVSRKFKPKRSRKGV